MAEKNNKVNLRNLVLAIMIIGGFASAFVFFDGQIDKRIQAHPSVVRLEEQSKTIKASLERIEEKVDELINQGKR